MAMHPLKKFEDGISSLFRWSPMGEHGHSMYTRDIVQILLAIAAESGAAKDGIAALRKQRGKTADADVVLVKAIAAALALHKCGYVLPDGDPVIALPGSTRLKLEELVEEARSNHEELAAAYGLTSHEIGAVAAYTSPNKDKPTLTYARSHKDDIVTEPNPYYMGKAYGPYKDGWAALGGALRKMPTLGDLGFTVHTFRVTRDDVETLCVERLEEDARVVLGFKRMKLGQHHFASTSLTYSVHLTSDRVERANGMLALVGTSGVFINWLGVMSLAVDGCEVLYPPGTVMAKWATITANGYQSRSGLIYRVHVFQEKTPSSSDMAAFRYVEDSSYGPVHATDYQAIADLRLTRFANLIEL